MKKLPQVFLLLLSLKGRSQEKESFYVFDTNWKPAKIKTAHFFLRTHQVNDSCWKWDYYNYMGPLVKTEQYRDKEGNELNGPSYYYDQKGSIDSITNFWKGRKNGDSWKIDGDSLKALMKYVYLNDSLIETIDLIKSKKDSAVSYKDEKESEYPGGAKGWARYLNQNLEYPERAQQSVIQGDVVIQFVVDKNGNVIDPVIARSVEYSLDEESLKIINSSGKWEPAFQNGHNVKSYKRQPVYFRLK